MHRFVFLSTVFVFLLPMQTYAMIVNTVQEFPKRVLLPNNGSSTYGLKLKKYDPLLPDIKRDIKMEHGKLLKPFIDFKRVKTAVAKEQEEKNNEPLKFLNKTPLIINEKIGQISIDEIFQNILKEKAYADNQAIVEQPKIENKKKKGKTVAFLINKKDGSSVPLGANQLNAERIVHLQETIINPVANKQTIIIPPCDIPMVPVNNEEEKAPEQAVVQPIDTQVQKDAEVVSLQVPAVKPAQQPVIVKQPVATKEELAIVPIAISKEQQEKNELLKLYQAIDDEIKWLTQQKDPNNTVIQDNLIKSLQAYKAYLEEKASGADPKKITQLMFKSYNGTLAATYVSILACMHTNDITIASSWLGKLLKCASTTCEAISNTKDHQLWFEMFKEILKYLATDSNEQGMQERYNKVLASTVGLVGFYGICNYTFQKWHSKDEKMQKSIFTMYEPFKKELEFCIEYLMQEYYKLPFKLNEKCPEEHLKIVKFLEKRAGIYNAQAAKTFCKNNPEDPATSLLLGTQKLEKAIIQDKATHYFKGLRYWKEMLAYNPHISITRDIPRVLQGIIAEESSFFSPFRRRALDILFSIKNPLLPEDEQYKQDQLVQKECVKKEIEEFDPIDKEDEEIKAIVLKAYEWGFDKHALTLLNHLKNNDLNTLLYCADLYSVTDPMKAYLLLSQEKLIQLGEQNPYDNHFAWYQAIVHNLIKQDIPQAATMRFLTSQFFKDKFEKISFEQNRDEDLIQMLKIPGWSFPMSILSQFDIYNELFSKDKDPKFIRTFELLLTAFAGRLIDHLSKKQPTILHSNNWHEMNQQKEWCKKQLTQFINKVGHYFEESLYKTPCMQVIMPLICNEFSKLSAVVKKDSQVAQTAAIGASYVSLIPTALPKDLGAEKKIWGSVGNINNLPVEQLDFYSQWLNLYYDNPPLKSLEKVYCAAFKQGDLDAFMRYINIIPDLIMNNAEKPESKNNAVFEKAEEQEYINTLMKNNPGQEVKVYSLWLQKKLIEGRLGIATEIVHDMSKHLCKKAIDVAQIVLDEKNLEAKLLKMNITIKNCYKSNELKAEIKKVDKLLNTYLDWLMDSALTPLNITWIRDFLFVGAFFKGLKIILNDIIGGNSNSDLNKLITKINQIDKFEQVLRLLIDPNINISMAKMGCDSMRIDNSNTVSVNLLKITAEMFCSLAEKALDDHNGFLVRKDWAYLFITNASDIVRNKLKGKDQKDLLDRLKLVSDKAGRMNALIFLPEKFLRITNRIKQEVPAQAPSERTADVAVINQVTKQAELANEQLKQAECSYEEMNAIADALFEQDEYKGLKEELDL